MFDVNIKKRRCGVQWVWCCVSCAWVALQSAARLKNLTTILTTFTAWSGVLFAMVIVSQVVKNFPASYGTRMLITAYARARHLFLFWARLYQKITPTPSMYIRFVTRPVFRWEIVSTSQSPQAGGPPLVYSPRLFIQYFRSYRPYWRLFLHPQSDDTPCYDDMDPLITDLKIDIGIIIVVLYMM